MDRKLIPMFKPYIPAEIDMNIPLGNPNIVYGMYGQLFEQDLRKFLNNDLTSTYVNFNIAYFTLLSAIGINKDDEVLVSPLACLESIQPLKAYGLNIKWVDVNRYSGLIDVDLLEKHISKKTKLIVINHFLGNVANIDRVNVIADKYSIKVVNDCNEAFGSKHNNYYLGDINLHSNFIFNFSAVRNPNTVTGAAVSYSDKNEFIKSTMIRDNGIDRTNFRTANGEINPFCDIKLVGYSGIMNELSSYIGHIQMKHINSILLRQKLIALKWETIFDKYFPEITQNMNENNDRSNYWVYGFHTSDIEITIEKINKLGFSCSKVHINNNIYNVFSNKKILAETNKFMKSLLAVPTGWWINEDLLDIGRVSSILSEYIHENMIDK